MLRIVHIATIHSEELFFFFIELPAFQGLAYHAHSLELQLYVSKHTSRILVPP